MRKQPMPGTEVPPGFSIRRESSGEGRSPVHPPADARRSGPVWSHAHELLAEIGALQQAHESARRAVDPLGDELFVLEFPLAEPARHVAQEIAVTRGEIADD